MQHQQFGRVVDRRDREHARWGEPFGADPAVPHVLPLDRVDLEPGYRSRRRGRLYSRKTADQRWGSLAIKGKWSLLEII
ncbi:hypothetical protein GCM10009559_17820 [Pseudonocardia zijingensis]|uniref:Uncharacterized protein n=1 Tax=Pseudonocardia zijingensis TaxID=153376 RepID=A0ABN1PMH5_9PSEU